ncbi:hypothetical protein FZ103_15790 [Streptomonospora sp. PA3]|uniref:hypothetical protein n=1 Tax=Streptomonospora sp. PA3 TaxID=2607326 RepID=UPI0012DF7024|nr:hypothetical protein [Streptomonospora sp. PA3]MUL42615.1 hypothetical protein [Streptomonospora sp. PA3]
MDSAFLIVIVVVLVLICLIGCAIAVPILLRRRESGRWAAWARENGWTYEAKRPDMVAILVTAIHPQNYEARHVLSRPHRGRWVFTYEHVERLPGSAGNAAHYSRAVAVSLPVPVPKVDIGDGSMKGLADFMGTTVAATGHPRFDALYRVRTADEDFARAVLTPQAMDRLIDRHARSRPPVRLNGHYIATAEDGHLAPEQALQEADELIDLLEAIPQQVWDSAART